MGVNIAHVRVAGLGGLGLVLVSVVVTFQYALLATAAVAGLVGGVLCGVALILYRSHRPGSSSSIPPLLSRSASKGDDTWPRTRPIGKTKWSRLYSWFSVGRSPFMKRGVI